MNLYDWTWNTNHGFIVHRTNSFLSGEDLLKIKTAVFVTQLEAENYCEYRNYMTDKYGDDDVTKIIDYK